MVDEASSDLLPVVLEAEGVNWGEAFTQTFYVRYKSNLQLNQLFEQIHSRLGKFIDYNLVPHLSLVYSHRITKKDKKEEITRVSFPKLLQLDRLMVIVKQGTIISREEDVLGWKVVWEKQLTI